MPQIADVLVLGVGGVGAAACLHAARRGLSVIGIDRFPPGHNHGSSHGSTRIIRLAYFEHPDYVPLLRRAYELWEDLARETGESLYVETGLLEAGPESGAVVQGILTSARLHGLAIDRWTPADLAERCPEFRIGEGMAALFERRAGFLRVEDCTRAHARLASEAGALLRIGESVLGWNATGNGVAVRTDRDTYSAARLIVTAGPWAPEFLADLGIRFEIVRKSMYWYEAELGTHRVEDGSPCYFFDTPEGEFYGFPAIDGDGLKVAEHSRGLPVADPLAVDRSEHPEETGRVETFRERHLPRVTRRRRWFETCLYTLSPDRNFVVDRHPEFPQVALAAGLSGHGFKFASVLGEVLANLGPGETPSAPIGFLSRNRFQTGPGIVVGGFR